MIESSFRASNIHRTKGPRQSRWQTGRVRPLFKPFTARRAETQAVDRGGVRSFFCGHIPLIAYPSHFCRHFGAREMFARRLQCDWMRSVGETERRSNYLFELDGNLFELG